MAKAKQINYELIHREDQPGMYVLLDQLVEAHFPHLDMAEIALAWRKALKPDPDGRLVLGKLKKASDLDRELSRFDFVILLNQEAWEEDLAPDQHEALLFHELCHTGVVTDKDGSVKLDSKGRRVYRTRRHDIEEFTAVVERYGCYKADLVDFAVACAEIRKAEQEAPLFANASVTNPPEIEKSHQPRADAPLAAPEAVADPSAPLVFTHGCEESPPNGEASHKAKPRRPKAARGRK